MAKKSYDTYLEALLDDAFLVRDREYVNDKGKLVVEGVLKDREGGPYPDDLVLLSTLMTNIKKPGAD